MMGTRENQREVDRCVRLLFRDGCSVAQSH
jgi:hypothetical protein